MTAARGSWFRFHLATLVFAILVVSTLLALNLVPREEPGFLTIIPPLDPRVRFLGWPFDWGKYKEGVQQGALWVNWWDLAYDAVIALAITVATGVIFERWFRRKAKR